VHWKIRIQRSENYWNKDSAVDLKGRRVTKQVTVIVDGCKYIVEVGDLRERPIKATINQKTYHVQLPTHGSPTNAENEVSRSESGVPTIQEIDCASITAPIPGDILEVKVKPGDSVEPGDLVCVLEAMKMKNMIRSNRTGVIESVYVSTGQSVDYGAVLVTFE
jgi:acetyl-CoA/propionyl-CoA carboxylase biotin carboxyl carrier protein